LSQASLSHRVGGRRRGGHGLARPHRSDVDNRAAALLAHVAGNRLGEEERAPVQVQIAIVVRERVVEEGFGSKHAGPALTR
jgi:hypothetical protein